MLKMKLLMMIALTVGLGQPVWAASANSAARSVPSGNDTIAFRDRLPVTPQEIATIDVLNDICPAFLNRNQLAGFRNGQHTLLSEMMPGISSPEQAVQLLRRTDSEYKRVLAEARTLASQARSQENREICLEVVNYRPAKPAASTSRRSMDVPVKATSRTGNR